MAGLNCGTPSLIAWPLVSQGIDVFVAAPDERAREAMRLLADAGIVSGESGAAGLAGLLELDADPDASPAREVLGLGPSSRLLLLSTEGATDPDAVCRHRRTTGRCGGRAATARKEVMTWRRRRHHGRGHRRQLADP